MENDDQSEDGQNSLSDGTYEIISQSSFHTSDNESHDDGDESLLSFGIPTPEEGSSVDGDDYIAFENVDATQPRLNELDDVRTGPVHECRKNSAKSSVDQSLISSGTITESQYDGVKFKESIDSNLNGLVEETQHLSVEKELDSSPRIRVVVRRALSSSLLKLNSLFRIKFCAAGSEVHLKEAVLEKIGQALHLSAAAASKANQRSTKEKLNIVPISAFGADGTVPEVMLLPFTGLQIEVEDCSGLYPFAGVEKTISAPKSDVPVQAGESRISEVPKNQIPDLAIFVHKNLSSDYTELMSGLAMSEQFKRQGVPVIDICGNLPYNESATSMFAEDIRALSYLNFRPSKERAVHMGYDIMGDSESSFLSFATPLDHQTFQQMEPHELNRNIAAITKEDSVFNFADVQRLLVSYVKVIWPRLQILYAFLVQICDICFSSVEGVARCTTENFDKPDSKQLRVYFARILKDALVGLAVCLSVGLLLWCFHGGAALMPEWPRADVAMPSTTATTVTSKQSTWPTQRQTLPVPAAPPLLSVPPPKRDVALTPVHRETGLSNIYRPQKPPTRPISKTTAKFKLLETEDGRLFLRLIKHPTSTWKLSESSLYAFQQSKALEITFDRVRDDTFELHLTRIHLCAPIVVTVSPSDFKTGYETFRLSSPCWHVLLADKLMKACSEVRSKMTAVVPELVGTVYRCTSGVSHETTKSVNDFYEKWIPKMLCWSRNSLARMKSFPQNVKNAQLTLSTMADEHFGFLVDRITDKREAVAENLEYQLSLGQAALNNGYMAVYSRARQLYKMSLLKALRITKLSQVAPVPVRVARARAVRFKDRMATRGARAQHWVSQAQGRLHKLMRLQAEPLLQRTKRAKRRCRVNRGRHSN